MKYNNKYRVTPIKMLAINNVLFYNIKLVPS